MYVNYWSSKNNTCNNIAKWEHLLKITLVIKLYYHINKIKGISQEKDLIGPSTYCYYNVRSTATIH